MEPSIPLLVEKLTKGTCSSEEVDLLLSYFEAGDLRELEQAIQKTWNSDSLTSLPLGMEERTWKKIDRKLTAKAEPSISGKRHSAGTKGSNGFSRFLKYAAVFIGVLLLSVIFYNNRSITNEIPANVVSLELNDGSIKALEEVETETLIKPGLVFKGRKLVYKESEVETAAEPAFNSLRVPNGKKFQVVLSDGTEVYLNAGTFFRYPENFPEGGTRKVFLEGEAFFKVAKGEQSFVVNTTHLKTEVLGTEFNVSAYPEATSVAVSLLEGKVSVQDEKGKQLMLAPDQMAVLRMKTLELSLEEIDAMDKIAWVEGVLLFKDEPFSDILPILERQYDVELLNRNSSLLNKRFTGRFQDEELQDILKVFSTAVPFTYQRTGSRILITE